MRLFLVATYLMLLVSSNSAFAQLVTVHYDTIAHAELIAPSDPRFIPLRNDILKAAGTNQSIDTFVPIAIVLHNKNQHPILGYAIRWEVVSPSGETSKFNLIWWQKLALAVLKGETGSSDPAKVHAAYMVQVVAPGASRLISPFFNLSRQSDVARLGTSSFSGPAQFPMQVLNAASISVTLDSAVYGDGLCEGEDVLNLCSSINGQLDGVRSLVENVRTLKASGATHNDILDQLFANSDAKKAARPSRSSSAPVWGTYARAMLIEDIERTRSQYGDDQAIEEIYRADTSFRVHR